MGIGQFYVRRMMIRELKKRCKVKMVSSVHLLCNNTRISGIAIFLLYLSMYLTIFRTFIF